MKLIGTVRVDYDDMMSVINLVEDLNSILEPYGISIETDDEEHDGEEVVNVFLKN